VYVGSQREWVRDERGLPMWTWAEPQRLRTAEWLSVWNHDTLRMTGTARLGVIDVRPAAAYALGHVPHAHHLPAERWTALRGDPQALRAAMAASGLDPAHEIVIVGQGGAGPGGRPGLGHAGGLGAPPGGAGAGIDRRVGAAWFSAGQAGRSGTPACRGADAPRNRAGCR
jgi:hypothetical protein